MRLLLLFLLISCGKVDKQSTSTVTHSESDINPVFKEYVDAYEKEIGINVDNIVIEIVEKLPPNIVASCTQLKDSTRLIRFSKEHYTKLSTNKYCLEQVVFHELGHCIQNKQHNNNTYLNIPISIMYPNVLNCDIYILLRSEYHYQLKTGDNKYIIDAITELRQSK